MKVTIGIVWGIDVGTFYNGEHLKVITVLLYHGFVRKTMTGMSKHTLIIGLCCTVCWEGVSRDSG